MINRKATRSEVGVKLEVALHFTTATAVQRVLCIPTLFANAFNTGILFGVNLLTESVRLSVVNADESLRVFRFQTLSFRATHSFFEDIEAVGVVFGWSEVGWTLYVSASDGRFGAIAVSTPSRVAKAALLAGMVHRHYFTMLIHLSLVFTTL